MNPDNPFVNWLKTLNENSVWVGTKFIFMLAFGLYVCFAVVVVSQVSQMRKTIKGGFESPITLLTWIHLLISVLAFGWALVAL